MVVDLLINFTKMFKKNLLLIFLISTFQQTLLAEIVRVFVIKKTGATPLSNRAMNYVYSSNNEIDSHQPSPYTKKSIDYVLSTTKENLNEWVTVKVNVKEHFKKFHDLDVNDIDGVAIMTDTDNSKKLAIAYYQNIYFSSE